MNPITVVAPAIVEQELPVGSGKFIFRAEEIRSEKTGIHAIVSIYYNTAKMADDLFNIRRARDRTSLCNAAHKALGPDREAIIDKDVLLHELMLFTGAVGPALMKVGKPKAVRGSMMGPLGFIAKPLILEKGGTILFGPGGSGKSTLAFLLAIAIDSGTNGIWETTQTRVLYANLERSEDSIVRRIFAVNSALGLDPDRPLSVITARGKSLSSLEPLLREYIREQNIGLLILDSISRARMGKLTDDDTANMTIDILNSFGVAWLAIGHTSKENANETFGSVHYGNGADITVKLTAEKRGALETGVHLETKKANDIAFPPPMTLALTFDRDYGLHTAKIAGPEDYPDLAKDTRLLPQKIHDYLLNEKGKASAAEIGEALGVVPSGISRILNADDRFVSLGRQGREVIYGVKRDP